MISKKKEKVKSRRMTQTRIAEFTDRPQVCRYENIEPSGDHLVDRTEGDGILRVGSQNCRGTDVDKGMEVATEVDTMFELGSDVQGLSETNKPWTSGNKYKYDFMMQAMFGLSKTVYSSTSTHHKSKYQPGGNLLAFAGNATGRIKETGSDKWNRFCWACLRGQRDEGVAFIQAYRVCHERNSNAGPFTAYQREFTAMKEAGYKKPNPRKQILKDLLKLIQSLRSKGYRPVLMMDANGDYNSATDPDEDLRKFISEANLVDHYYEKFKDSPRTFIRGSKRLDYHLFDPGVVSSILRIGYLGTHEGADTDHVYGYCDFDSKKLFQGVINRPITLHSRDFLLAQTDKIKDFLEALLPKAKHHRIQERTFKLARSFVENGKSSANLSTYKKLYNEFIELAGGGGFQDWEEKVWIHEKPPTYIGG